MLWNSISICLWFFATFLYLSLWPPFDFWSYLYFLFSWSMLLDYFLFDSSLWITSFGSQCVYLFSVPLISAQFTSHPFTLIRFTLFIFILSRVRLFFLIEQSSAFPTKHTNLKCKFDGFVHMCNCFPDQDVDYFQCSARYLLPPLPQRVSPFPRSHSYHRLHTIVTDGL